MLFVQLTVKQKKTEFLLEIQKKLSLCTILSLNINLIIFFRVHLLIQVLICHETIIEIQSQCIVFGFVHSILSGILYLTAGCFAAAYVSDMSVNVKVVAAVVISFFNSFLYTLSSIAFFP